MKAVTLVFAILVVIWAQKSEAVFEGLPVTCQILTYHLYTEANGDENMYTQLSDVRGIVKKVLASDAYTVDFTAHLKQMGLTKWNAYVQDRFAQDCRYNRAEYVKLVLGK